MCAADPLQCHSVQPLPVISALSLAFVSLILRPYTTETVGRSLHKPRSLSSSSSTRMTFLTTLSTLSPTITSNEIETQTLCPPLFSLAQFPSASSISSSLFSSFLPHSLKEPPLPAPAVSLSPPLSASLRPHPPTKFSALSSYALTSDPASVTSAS